MESYPHTVRTNELWTSKRILSKKLSLRFTRYPSNNLYLGGLKNDKIVFNMCLIKNNSKTLKL